MAVKQIYLTIDDCPSIHMHKKVDILKQKNIPALFYARGEFINKHPDQIVYAIKNGFLIGNHSYSHPYFSEIDLAECFNEITKTEKLIDECYERAQIRRPHKVIRFPFGDRGNGGAIAGAEENLQPDKVIKIQNFVKDNGFVPVNFCSLTNDYIDSLWNWDTQDYEPKLIQEPKLYLDQLKEFYNTYPDQTGVILLHDFDDNHHLFDIAMDFLSSKNITFLEYSINI